MIRALLYDAVQAWRSVLRRRRTFGLATAILALSLGIDTALIRIVDGLTSDSQSIRDPNRLRYISARTDRGLWPNGVSYRDYVELTSSLPLVGSIAIRGPDRATVRHALWSHSEELRGEIVSANYFAVLGVPLTAGHLFGGNDETLRSSQREIIISHRLWETHFNSSSSTLGTVLWIDDRPYTIAGVASKAFHGTVGLAEESLYWLPVTQRGHDLQCTFPNYFQMGFFCAVVRFGDQTDDPRLASAIQGVSSRLQRDFRPSENSWTLAVMRSAPNVIVFHDEAEMLPSNLIIAISVVAVFILVIGTSNASGLVLAVGASRREGLALRVAVGATRYRLAQQLAAEAAIVSGAGCIGSYLVASWMVRMFAVSSLGAFLRPSDDRLFVATGPAVIAMWLCVVASLTVSAVVQISDISPSHVVRLLHSQGVTPTRSTMIRLRYWIIAPQIAISLTLLIAASCFAYSLLGDWWSSSKGYDSNGVAYARFELPQLQRCERTTITEKEHAQLRDVIGQRLLQSTASHASLVDVAVAGGLLFDRMEAYITNRKNESNLFKATWLPISPGFLHAMHMTLARGRDFEESDTTSSEPVVIVSESLTKLLWVDQDPMNGFVGFGDPSSLHVTKWARVIGIAKDVRLPLSGGRIAPTIYTAVRQGVYANVIVARGHGKIGDTVRSLESLIRDTDSRVNVVQTGTVSGEIEKAQKPRYVAAITFLLTGGFALFVAAGGLFGIVSYVSRARIREIAIRSALGAESATIVTFLMRDGAVIGIAGLLVGTAGGYAIVRVAARLVWLLRRVELVSLLAPVAFVGLIVALALYLPTRQMTQRIGDGRLLRVD